MPLSILSWAAGAFVLVAVALDWNWFFEHPKARFFVERFGRGGARVFYFLLGCALVVLGFACRNAI